MPVAGLTRETIRSRIGYILGAIKLVSAAANGSTTTFLTDDLWGDEDDYIGHWWLGTDTPNDGVQARVIDSSVSSNQTTLTLHPAVTSTLSGDTAELWMGPYDPIAVHNAINEAITNAYGMFYDPDEDITLHGGSKERYDIPTDLDILTDVYVREFMDSLQVIESGRVWDESVDADFTITQETDDLLFGRTSTKFVVAGTVSDGDLASEAIASMDLSGMTHIELPIKVNAAVISGDLALIFSATANGADTDKRFALPALSAMTDTWVRMSMQAAGSDPSDYKAIISIGLEANVNSGAQIVWLGEVRATRNDSYRWRQVPDHQWRVDKEARDLVFMYGAGRQIGYKLFKLVGGDDPDLLTSDVHTSELPEDYIVYRAAGMLMQRPVPGEIREAAITRRENSTLYLTLAEQAKGTWPILRNARKTA